MDNQNTNSGPTATPSPTPPPTPPPAPQTPPASKPTMPPSPPPAPPTPPTPKPAPPPPPIPMPTSTPSSQSNTPSPTSPLSPTMPPQPIPTPTPMVSKSKSNKKILISFILSITTLGLLGGAIYYSYTNGLLQNTGIPEILGLNSSKEAPPTKPEIVEDQTSDQISINNPSPTIAQPTNITPDNLPEGWTAYQHSGCDIALGYPPSWQVKPDCLTTQGITDCLMTNDFDGELLSTNPKVKNGLLTTISCSPIKEGTSTPTELLNQCRQLQLTATASTQLICNNIKTNNNNTVTMIKRGEYETIINNQIIEIKVYPAPPTTLNILSLIFDTLTPTNTTPESSAPPVLPP